MLCHLLSLQESEAIIHHVKRHLDRKGRFVIDIFVPEIELLVYKPNERFPFSEYGDPDGCGRIVVTHSYVYEADTQIKRIKTFHIVPDRDEEIECELNLRMYFPQELDGKSGAGKSTLASLIAKAVHAAVVQLDDFVTASIPDGEWGSRTVAERATNCFDWQRVRAEALEPLISRRAARWYPFDFDARHPDGTCGMKSTCVEIAPESVILLDGNFSTGPQLIDLVNLTVLVEAPDIEQHTRPAKREDSSFLQRWHARWDVVEEYYYPSVRPGESFDLVVTTGSHYS